MPTIILKADPHVDLYVGWSSVVEAPVFVGTRAEALAYFAGRGSEPVGARLDRADRTGTSALWGDPPREGAWEDSGLIYMQQARLPRANLLALAQRYRDATTPHLDVADLLTPFEDEES